MPNDSPRLLAIGDVHLGVETGSLPPWLREQLGTDGVRALGPEAAWERALGLARAESVTAILLAGDVLDSDGDRWRLRSRLAEDVRRLREDGISVHAVAGNHDAVALTDISRTIPDLDLVGAGGCWESRRITRSGGESVANLVGWSFPREHVHENPLATLRVADLGLDPSLPTIGLLHGDVGVPESRYAPLRRAELEHAGVDAWLLGHIHAPQPDALAAERPIGYLGTLAALSGKESGSRGAWLVSFDGRRVRLASVPLSPIRFETLEIELHDADSSPGALQVLLTDRIRALGEQVLREGSETRALGLVLRFVGRVRHAASRGAELRRIGTGSLLELEERVDDLRIFVRRVESELVEAIDLDELARETTPAGALARDLIELERSPGERPSGERPQLGRLIARARDRLREDAERFRLRGEDPIELDDDTVRNWLVRGARTALAELLATRVSASGEPDAD